MGILFDNTLCWRYHVDCISKRIIFLLRMLWTTTKHFNDKLRLQLVKSFILPHLLYGDIVIFGMQNQYFQDLQMVFNSCIRYVMRLRKYDHISQYANLICGCSLYDLYKFRVCLSIFKFLKYKQPSYIVSKMELLQSKRLQMIKPANNVTTLMNSSFFVKGISLWNSLSPIDLRILGTTASFRKKYFERFH